MKFISKSSNLLIVLSPGLSAQPLTGTPSKPTVSVRFKDGVAEVQQQELIDMMVAHPAFNSDFISAEDRSPDPYASSRHSSEPAHTLTEMKFGTPVARKVVGGDNPITTLPPEMQAVLKSMAADMAKEMLPSMVETVLKGILSEREINKTSGDKVVLTKAGKPKKKAGRKPKVKIEVTQDVPAVEENQGADLPFS